ncbi:MAG: TIR domain-containing protein [Candidatus Binatia bacterium]
MAYRNKTYVAFDGDNDMRYYNILKAWRDNDHIDFGFFDAHNLNCARDTSQTESIRDQLRERMRNSRLMLLLVGENTRYLTRFVAWEIKYAHKIDLPIVVANLNNTRAYDATRCPTTVLDGDVYTLHIPFRRDIVKYAVDNFPGEYRQYKGRLGYGAVSSYPASVYRRFGL